MTVTPQNIKEFIKEAKLPTNTKYLGFVIHLPDTDEFLKNVTYHGDTELREWAKIPDLAKIYRKKEKALREVKRYGKNAVVCYLLDTGNQFVLAKPE